MVVQALRLRDAGDARQIVLDIVLRLHAGVVRLRALRGGDAALAAEPDVLVVPDAALAQPAEDLVLFVAKAARPLVQTVHHLALDL